MSNLATSSELKVKHTAIEAVLKGTCAINDAKLLGELKPIYNAEYPKPTYTPENYVLFLEFMCQRLYPELSKDEALFEIGRKAFQGYSKETIIGRVAFAAIHLIGPVRYVTTGARLWRDAGIGDCQAEKPEEGKIRCTYRNFVISSSPVAGVALEGLSYTKCTNPRYRIISLPSPDRFNQNFDIIFEWD